MASIYAKRGIMYMEWKDAFKKRHQNCLGLPATREGWKLAEKLRRAKERELVINPLAHTLAVAELEERERSGVTLMQFYELAERENGKYGQKKAPNTVKLWKLSASKLKEYAGDIPIASITTDIMLGFRAWAVAKDGEQNAAAWIRNLGGLFKQARKRGALPASPITDDVRISQEKKAVVSMTQDEAQRLFVKAHEMKGEEFLKQIRFLAYTGFRADESCLIRRKQLFFEQGYIEHVNIKGHRVEPFPIYSKIAAMLEPLKSLPEDAFLFHYRSIHTLSHYFAEVRDKLDLDERYSLHTLKKVFVSTLIQSGVQQMNVNRLANHMDLQTTRDHYVWFDIDPLRDELERVAPMLP